MLRFGRGAKGMLWASQIAIGAANGLKLRAYGDRGGLEWSQEHPEELIFTPLGHPMRIYRLGEPGLSASTQRATRLPPGHPEGYLEAFAQIYADAAELVCAHTERRKANELATLAPGVEDGVRGVRFIRAAVGSHERNGAWTQIA